jgi:hypothetical protein
MQAAEFEIERQRIKLQHDAHTSTHAERAAAAEQAAAAATATTSAAAARKAASDRVRRESVRAKLQAHRAAACHLLEERRAAEGAAEAAAVAWRALEAEEGLLRVMKRRGDWERRVAEEARQAREEAEAAEAAKELRLQKIRAMVCSLNQY